jgi:hypothetical protein
MSSCSRVRDQRAGAERLVVRVRDDDEQPLCCSSGARRHVAILPHSEVDTAAPPIRPFDLST